MTTPTPRILFVDDDRNILQGLKRMLYSQRDQWEMHFATGSADALAAMDRARYDMVVSDMRMPDLDGADLLSLIEKQSPSTIRIILSGYAKDNSILRTVAPAHQYMAKPCDPRSLIAILDRALALRRSLQNEGLRHLVTSLRNLPTPPAIFSELLRAIDSPTASAATVAEVIGRDVAMTAALMKMTNSAFFSTHSAVASPLQAVRLLGLETVRALLLSAGLFRQFSGSSATASLLDTINRFSLHLGMMAHSIAKDLSLDSQACTMAFSAGMLSHIGTLLLVDQMPHRVLQVQAHIKGGQTLEQAEQNNLGASYTELGAYLLGLWGFDKPILEAVMYQNHPDRCPAPAINILTCLHIAVGLAPEFPLFAPARADLPPEPYLNEAYLDSLALTPRLAKWRLRSQQTFMEGVA